LTPGSLEELLYLGLDTKLEAVSPLDTPFQVQVANLIEFYNRRGAIEQLLNALIRSSASDQRLRSLAATLLRGRGLGAARLGIDLNDLNGAQKKLLHDSILHAFDLPMLQHIVKDELRHSFEGLPAPYEEIVFDLISRTQMEGWTDELVRTMQEHRPDHPQIRNLVSDLRQLDVDGDRRLAGRSLERTVRGRGFSDIAEWSHQLARIRNTVCRLERGGSPIGTGFLVAPDLVLTAFHAVQGYRDTTGGPFLTCRFDYAIESTGAQFGVVAPIAERNWLLAYSPPSPIDASRSDALPTPYDLDYALLRLADPIGRGLSPAGEKQRGWLPLREHFEMPAPKETVSIVQHPLGQPLTIAIGTVVGTNANGTRLRYEVDTSKGSGGAPCFDAGLNLVAMHQASYPGSYQQGIPIDRIVLHLRNLRNVPPFWTQRA
jgi:Trypsin-like peptidase domain/Effector-associated domain 1